MPFEDANSSNGNASYNNAKQAPAISYVPYAEADSHLQPTFASKSAEVEEPGLLMTKTSPDGFDIADALRNAYADKSKPQPRTASQLKSKTKLQAAVKTAPMTAVSETGAIEDATYPKRILSASQQNNVKSDPSAAMQASKNMDREKQMPTHGTSSMKTDAGASATGQGNRPSVASSKLARKQPAQQPVQQPVRQPAQQPARQPFQQPVQQPIRQPSQQPVRQPSQQPFQQPVQQPVQQPAQQPAQQSVPLIAENASQTESLQTAKKEGDAQDRLPQNMPLLQPQPTAAKMQTGQPQANTQSNANQFIPKLAVNPEKVTSAPEGRLALFHEFEAAAEEQAPKKKHRRKGKSSGSSRMPFGKNKKKNSNKSQPMSEDEWQGNFEEIISDFQAQDLEQQRKEAIAQIPKAERVKGNILSALKEPVVIIAILVVLFVVFVQKSFLVPSGSMIPTLLENDRIFTIKSYITDGHTFKPGDIVCFYAPNSGEVYVKRVIANGGSTVEISGDQVYVDGELSPYQGKGTGSIQGKWELADDEYFVMGDNRSNSKDSRYSEVGKIKAENMISRVVAIYWPIEDAKLLVDNPYPSESQSETH